LPVKQAYDLRFFHGDLAQKLMDRKFQMDDGFRVARNQEIKLLQKQALEQLHGLMLPLKT